MRYPARDAVFAKVHDFIVVNNMLALRAVKNKAEELVQDLLSRNDSYTFLKRTNDLLITGSTNTNVTDIHIVLVTRAFTEPYSPDKSP